MGVPNPGTAPSRTGMRRLIPPWEYRHLRVCGGTRTAAGILQAGLGVVTLSFGGNDAKTYGWSAFWLLLGVLNVAFGHWEMTIARPRVTLRSRS
jgi:hypothetical protein